MHFPGNSKMPLTSESYVDLRISDINLSQYIGITMSADNVEKICDSLLYRDPYPGCTCGHTDYHEDEPSIYLLLKFTFYIFKIGRKAYFN